MRDKCSKIYQMDDTLRLLFAFYSCISDNPNWILESSFSRQNHKIEKKIYPALKFSDYYFTLNDYFYGFTFEREGEESIFCTIDEYNTFYDFEEGHVSMDFTYHIPSKTIVNLGEVKRIQEEEEKQYKKVA